MKAWKKTVALLMALGMTFSIVACGDTESSSSTGSTGSTGGEETKVPTTETEMFEYVMDAMDALNSYTGSVTMTMNGGNTMTSKTGDEDAWVSENLMSMTMSFDAVNKLMYMDSIDVEDGAKNEYYCKTFVQGGKLYGVEKGKFTPPPASSLQAEEGADYFEIHDSVKAEYQTMDYSEYTSEYLEGFDGVKLAANPAEVKAAFDTVLPVVLASQVPEGAETTITTTASATGANGVYTFALGFEAIAVVEAETTTTTQSMVMATSLSAKDGKLVGFEASNEMKSTTTQTDGTTVTTITENSMANTATATIDYTFAQAKYDAVTVELPTNPEDIHMEGGPAESYSDLEIDLYVNGEYYYTTEWFEDNATAAVVLESIISNANYFPTDSVEIKAYKDEACTQELTAGAVTEADILALEKVYLKVTPNTGYVMVKTFNEERYDLSKPYQIVLPLIGGYSSEESVAPPQACEVGEYDLWEDAVSGDDYEIWVNGVKMETKTATITLESGTVYEIKYIKVITDPVVAEEE